MTEQRKVMVDGRLLINKMPEDHNLYRMRVPIKAVQIHEPFTFRAKGGMFKAKAGDYFICIETAIQAIIYKLDIGFHALDEKLFASMYEEVGGVIPTPEVKPAVTATEVIMEETKTK